MALRDGSEVLRGSTAGGELRQSGGGTRGCGGRCVGQVVAPLGWRFWIRTDSVEGCIRADSYGFRAAPQSFSLRHVTVCMGMYGHVERWVPYRNRFRIRTHLDGFLDPKYGGHQPSSAWLRGWWGWRALWWAGGSVPALRSWVGWLVGVGGLRCGQVVVRGFRLQSLGCRTQK